jgi:hypothetical protein
MAAAKAKAKPRRRRMEVGGCTHTHTCACRGASASADASAVALVYTSLRRSAVGFTSGTNNQLTRPSYPPPPHHTSTTHVSQSSSRGIGGCDVTSPAAMICCLLHIKCVMQPLSAWYVAHTIVG